MHTESTKNIEQDPYNTEITECFGVFSKVRYGEHEDQEISKSFKILDHYPSEYYQSRSSMLIEFPTKKAMYIRGNSD